MTTDPRKDDPGDDPRKDLSIMHLYMLGGRMVDDYDEDDAVEDFLLMHPEARESDVRAELTRVIEANDERMRPLAERLRSGE